MPQVLRSHSAVWALPFLPPAGADAPPWASRSSASCGCGRIRCELRRARWLADTAAAEHGLDADAQFRFTFAANEAVANAIEHGEASPEGHIVVRSSSSAAGDLTFEVRDWGTFTPHLSEADALPDRGRGLALMATMVDEVDVAPTGDSTVVRLVMRARSKAA